MLWASTEQNKRGEENVTLLLEADVATIGHSYDRIIEISSLLSPPSGLGVHADLAVLQHPVYWSESLSASSGGTWSLLTLQCPQPVSFP